MINMSMDSHGGIILTGKTKEFGEKPVPLALCLPQIPHGRLTRASAVRCQRQTTCTMAWPLTTRYNVQEPQDIQTAFQLKSPLILSKFVSVTHHISIQQ
jgi:hypothetical protein